MTDKQLEVLVAAIKWNESGLVPAIAQDADTGEVLMMAWMNASSLRLTMESHCAVYFSRSRQSLWRKGETSGHIQEVISVKIDCDADCVLIKVRQTGVACHTGKRSCFYRTMNEEGVIGNEC